MLKMKVQIDASKTVTENAAIYYEKAKKAKKKIAGAEAAIEETKRKIANIKNKPTIQQTEKKKIVRREKEWYEKFRWFFSSEGFLIIGGKDAQ